MSKKIVTKVFIHDASPFEESKHKRNHGQFSATEGAKGAAPGGGGRSRADLEAAHAESTRGTLTKHGYKHEPGMGSEGRYQSYKRDDGHRVVVSAQPDMSWSHSSGKGKKLGEGVTHGKTAGELDKHLSNTHGSTNHQRGAEVFEEAHKHHTEQAGKTKGLVSQHHEIAATFSKLAAEHYRNGREAEAQRAGETAGRHRAHADRLSAGTPSGPKHEEMKKQGLKHVGSDPEHHLYANKAGEITKVSKGDFAQESGLKSSALKEGKELKTGK